jgi:hypothetical protein
MQDGYINDRHDHDHFHSMFYPKMRHGHSLLCGDYLLRKGITPGLYSIKTLVKDVQVEIL